MDKKRIELIAVSILALVLILAWANSIKTLKRRKSAVISPQVKAAPAKESAPLAVEKKEDWDKLKWVRDPFSGKVYSGGASGPIDLELQGISWDEKKPQALIGGEIVKEGDTLGNSKVIKINKDSVLLNDGTKDLELKLE